MADIQIRGRKVHLYLQVCDKLYNRKHFLGSHDLSILYPIKAHVSCVSRIFLAIYNKDVLGAGDDLFENTI